MSELIDQRSEEPAPGRHRVTTQPHIPTQTVPVHDGVDAAEVAQAPAVEVRPEVTERSPEDDWDHRGRRDRRSGRT